MCDIKKKGSVTLKNNIPNFLCISICQLSFTTGGMSRVVHRLFLDKLIPHTWADNGPAPVLLNTWEAR